MIFMNFRADRARQLTPMTEADFDGFQRRSFVQLSQFTTLTQYADDIDSLCFCARDAKQYAGRISI